MRISVPAALIACLAAPAFAGITYDQIDTFTDSSNDLFDNGFSNLDITQVVVSQHIQGQGAVLVDIAITTRGMSDWTKYMIFMGDGSTNGVASNPWNRPVDLGSNRISGFIGGWIDGAGGNQMWGLLNGWQQFGSVSQSVDWGANTVHFSMVTVDGAGQTLFFDVATSGGGNDPGVDHLSRSDMATSGWGNASVAGQFRSFTIVPAPGLMGLMACAGVLGSRRRK